LKNYLMHVKNEALYAVRRHSMESLICQKSWDGIFHVLHARSQWGEMISWGLFSLLCRQLFTKESSPFALSWLSDMSLLRSNFLVDSLVFTRTLWKYFWALTCKIRITEGPRLMHSLWLGKDCLTCNLC
jgi:hypothetical protein